ncbi:Gfo/Idh/MocA family oxidoreductase [Microbacterium limosum]|uniref:Gfo/Idh/MocA family oxidoreductase n=1 Tax=Microbacterium limosum TaxID=3079935 RepID=A0AAU0MI63_9MICO|nr:Gfo/Idh/MocA family oxidoreductase [Microbacterium sp. Y20]WOQ70147.1 Gfo/Idh/MocA family oxidoreductase [Microbacterium sp. Y20]
MNLAKGDLTVALVGLRFGAEFAPIYQAHPDVREVVLCDSDPEQLETVGARFGISRRMSSLEEVLAAPDIDAVHLVTPLTLHGSQSIQVMESGKHCAVTIPAALSMEELDSLVDVEKRTGMRYMMMETAVYTREFLFVREMFERGEFGALSFARGAHLQDMEGWPAYWRGFPPIAHITHALAPVLALTGTGADRVHCFGSGRLSDEMASAYGNPFPVETAIFRLDDVDISVEVTRSMFRTARPYTESFAIYGDRLGFEWPQLEDEQPLLFEMGALSTERGRPIDVKRLDVPDRADLLPEEIRPFTRESVYQGGDHLSFVQGGGHGGSHPHLVHEFVRAVVEDRQSAIDAATAANWTAAGLAAHESAMQQGAEVTIPRFDHQLVA